MATTGGATVLIQSCIDFVTTHRRQLCSLASVVLFVACLLRYWVSFNPSASLPRGFGEAISLARSLNDDGTFANPFGALDTGPSAHLSPVFPAFLALLMKVFGVGSTGHYALLWAARLILALQLALYPRFSRMLGMGEINGIIAASIWLVAGPMLSEGWESIYAAMLVAAACCCYRLYYLAREPQRRRRMAWFLGCLMGCLIFALPTMAPVYAVWLAWEMWRQKRAFLKESLVPLILLPVLVIVPWTVRNSLVFHRFLLIRDDLGLELSVSNNDCARFGTLANIASGCFDKVHPNHNLTEARKVMEMGEVNYNDLRLREALHWISTHPVRFTKLTSMRFVAFWMPAESFTMPTTHGRRRERVVIYLMTLLSVVGLVILYQRDVTSAAILLSCLTVFPLIYYVIQFQDRYRYPIMWVTFLLGAMPITTCARRLWETPSALPGPPDSSK